jgi:hypothetical protein
VKGGCADEGERNDQERREPVEIVIEGMYGCYCFRKERVRYVHGASHLWELRDADDWH